MDDAITWLPFGPISSYRLGNKQTVKRTYDGNYRLTDLTSPALKLHFQRDVMGDIIALGSAPGASPATETYSYDPLYRLGGVSDAGTTLEGYTYDKTGDRLSKSGSGLATGAYLYTSGTHQLASIANVVRSTDANGNTTASTVGGEAFGFSYNDRNRLDSAQRDGQTVGVYTYNTLGQRIGKQASYPQTVNERYAYNEAGQLIGEYGTTNRDYVWLGNIPVAVIDNTINGSVTSSVVNYVTADQLGTPRAVTDGSGAVLWQWAYQGNPFGEQPPTSSSGYVLNLRYPGQYYDAETGTNYNYFRNYEPATGRYLQSDPIGLNGGVSTYAYVGGNPLSRVDPYGLWSVTITAIDGIGGAFVFGKDNQTGQWFWGGRIGLGVEDGVSLDPMGKRPGRDETPCHGTTVGTYIEAGVTVGPWTWNPVQGNAGVDPSTGDDYHEGPAAADTATMNNSPKYGLDIGGSIGGEVIYH